MRANKAAAAAAAVCSAVKLAAIGKLLKKHVVMKKSPRQPSKISLGQQRLR